MFPYAPSHGYTPRTISGIPAPTKQDELYTASYKYFPLITRLFSFLYEKKKETPARLN